MEFDYFTELLYIIGMDMIVVLHNIRSIYNVGAIIRTAEGMGVGKVIFSGYTPRIHDERLLPHLREKINREIHKTALGAEDMINAEYSDDIVVDLKRLKSLGWGVVGLENNIQVNKIIPLNSMGLKEVLADKIVLFLGEEVDGINPMFYDLIDCFVEIPMRGQKESFNVSVAAGIAMYGIMYS